MKFYFSSKDIPALAKAEVTERNHLVYQAQQKLSVPQKLVLNLLKLVLLIPPFLFLARQEWGILAVALFTSFAGYALLFRPVFFSFVNKVLAKSSQA